MKTSRTQHALQTFIYLGLMLWVLAHPPAHAQAVNAMQLTPSTLAGGSGGTATGIVTLAAPAPAGGVVLQLNSSNPELAATVPQITVAAGQTQASFVVATNALYRRYSGLGFSANISASNPLAAGTGSAAINVTAQARPNVTVLKPDPNYSGPVCAGDPGLLYDCASGRDGQCSFRQECVNGCQTRAAQNLTWRDQCAIAGPYPIVTNPKRIVGGSTGFATLQLASGAPAGSSGLVASSSLVAAAQTRTQVVIPTGAASLAMPLNSAAVNRIQFAAMEGVITTPQILSGGGVFYAQRLGRAWVAVTPGAAPAPSLVRHQLDNSSVLGGVPTFGTTCINQLAPAPEVGSIALSVSSSNNTVARVVPAVLTQGADCLSFAVETFGIAANTSVSVRAVLGSQVLVAPLLVTATPRATQVNSFFLDPFFVAGGESSLATIVLDGLAPPSGFLVSLSSDNTPALALPASVTVPAGSDRVNLSIGTRPVAADSLVTISFTPAAAGLVAQLTVNAAAAAPALTSISVSPATVVGGSTATGSVILSGAAQVASVVALSSNSSAASVPPSVTVPVGASSALFVVNTAGVAANTLATLSGALGSITRLGTLTVAPASGGGGLAAPALQSPANDARFDSGQNINFDWSDVAGATSYVIEIDDSNAFTAQLTLRQSLSASQLSTNTLPVAQMYWRVRALDGNGNPGAWSAVRQIRVR
jgi:trimeric autotransporter adhesin